MKKILLTSIAIGLLAFHSNAQERNSNTNINTSKMNIQDEKHSFNEIKEVAKALEPYITAAKTGDGKLGRSAFFDHAHIVGSIGGTHYNMTADDFRGAVDQGGPSENVQSHIAWIDISGPAAAAKVEFIDWSGLRFTDFFVLYKNDGVWKISGKVYDSHSNN
ncbi:nuclear transport factor 2 family protein [Maribacter algarum]|uniref:Nuclear transport factor 2 family protein n=1 Tax=Maribacter algarum (ex Zhang et al. 2020) TaxID=2578118 RepID=A0A5S3PV25_9FLAO|nr:nuclear transport factor 2 family protein [Maribacter algarum]TMM58042.1 nuclear transport factor 2 family protein [Maribacter algarum]